MKQKWKVILIVLLVTLICTLSIWMYSFLHQSSSQKENSSTPQVSDTPQNTISSTNEGPIVFSQYSVYESADVSFRFIVAQLDIQSDAEKYALSDFVTSEGIVLNDIQTYVKQLENANLFVGKKNVWFSFSDKTSFSGNILIPITNNETDTISVSCKNKSYDFDLTQNHADCAELEESNNDKIVSQQDIYQLRVTNIFEITGDDMYQNDTLMTMPSSTRIFAIKVDAAALNGNMIHIDRAVYEENDGTQLEAEDASIHSMKYENLIGQDITEEKEACFFFVDSNLQNTKGVLHIYINGSDTPVDVEVSQKGA